MRRSTRRELRMLRGIVRSLFHDKVCRMCKEPMLSDKNEGHGFGDYGGLAIDDEFSEHHKNGNHHDNRPVNREWVHRRCHKSYHMAQRWAAKRRSKKGGR